MNFFEKELQKIVDPIVSDATYVGRACYVRLSETNRAKLQFTTLNTADHYPAIKATILNNQEGMVDTVVFRFSDLLGKKATSHSGTIIPYIWEAYGKAEWYIYQPKQRDYDILSKAVEEYLSVFMEPAQNHDQQWTQTMQ